MSKLDNYRTHLFRLFGQELTIAGMAGPHNNPDVDEALEYLKNTEKREVLIGLHETKNFTEQAHQHGLKYYYVTVPDLIEVKEEKELKLTDPIIFDTIYVIVKKSTAEGKQVAIHCGAGDGRTGTALAALKLRELLEAAAHANPAILNYNPEKTTTVYSPYLEKNVPCTPLVKEAINQIRTLRMEKNENGSFSVETENDVNSLIEYEKHLRVVIKKELIAKAQATAASSAVSKDSHTATTSALHKSGK